MSKDLPDYIGTVGGAPTAERAAGGIGRYSGSATSYQTVKSWTVAVATIGQLLEMSITSTILAKTHWEIVIDGVTFCEDLLQDAPLSIPFGDLKLTAGAVVIVSCKSTDGSSINADACITAKEFY